MGVESVSRQDQVMIVDLALGSLDASSIRSVNLLLPPVTA
jgi:hypothetical protein